MDEVKAKLDSVHKLLRKQVSFVEDAEGVEDRAEEEEVNYIGGAVFKVLETRVETKTPMEI